MANLECINVQPLSDDRAPDYRPGRALHFKFLQSRGPGFPSPQTRGVDGDGGQFKQSKRTTNVLVVILGAEGVGKKAFMNKLSYGNIHQSIETVDPVGDLEITVRYLVDGKTYCIELSPLSNCLYGALVKQFQRSATIIAYSVTSAISFDYARNLLGSATRHIAAYRTPVTDANLGNLSHPYPIMLLGLKTDEPGRQVTRADGERLASEHRCIFAEASAKQGVGVLAAVGAVIESVHQLETAFVPTTTEEEMSLSRQKALALWHRWVASVGNP